MNPYLLVNVNGSNVGVGIGSNLRSLLRSMKMSEDKILPTLAITRLWGGKPIALEFDRSLPDVLNLVLVDFKGGATFAGMSRLGHVAAVITNLGNVIFLANAKGDTFTDPTSGDTIEVTAVATDPATMYCSGRCGPPPGR